MDKLNMGIAPLIAIIIIVIFVLIGGGMVYYYFATKNNPQNEGTVKIDGISPFKLIGTWQSNEDNKSTIVFSLDGTLKNIYDGQVIDTGEWSLLTKLKGTEFEKLGDGNYLKQVIISNDVDSESSIFYYSININTLDEKTLDLTYLSRGNTLTYTKIK